jgi:hypothetical protein
MLKLFLLEGEPDFLVLLSELPDWRLRTMSLMSDKKNMQ